VPPLCSVRSMVNRRPRSASAASRRCDGAASRRCDGGVTVPLRGGVTVPLRGRSGAGPRCAHADGRTGADSGKSGCWMAPHTRRKGADRLSVQLAADRAANRWGKVTPSNTALIGSQVSVGAGASVTFFLDAGRAPPCCMSWFARACSANAIPTSTARRSWADWQQRPMQFQGLHQARRVACHALHQDEAWERRAL